MRKTIEKSIFPMLAPLILFASIGMDSYQLERNIKQYNGKIMNKVPRVVVYDRNGDGEADLTTVSTLVSIRLPIKERREPTQAEKDWYKL